MASIRVREVPDGQRADGTPKMAKRYHVRYRDPAGKQREKVFRRRKDAETFRVSVEADQLAGVFIDPRKGRQTFAEWWADSYRPGRVDLRPSSRARDESCYRNHIEPAFGDVPLGMIDHQSVVAWVADLTASGLAPATVHKVHQVFSRAMRQAVAADVLRSSPCDLVSLPEIPDHEMQIITPGEVEALAASIDPRYRAFVFLGAYGGLRYGELAALRWANVNLLARTVHVCENVTEVKGTHHVGQPKTRRGTRTVPITPLVCDELARHAEGVTGELVFPAPNGGYLRASLFRRRVWQPAAVRAGLGEWLPPKSEGSADRFEGFNIHGLRHTAVSYWIATGVSPKEVAVRAGHRSVVTVFDRYGHLLPRDNNQDDALEAMARDAREAAGGSACGISVGFSSPTVTPLRPSKR